jgi:hypothetical protein
VAAAPAISPAQAAAPKPAKLAISPASHPFDSVVVGSNSTGQSFAITNTGQ